VDFDNILSSLRRLDPAAARVFATDPLRWANWLQDRLGAVGPLASEETPRVLLQKICYLNPAQYGNYRAYFTRAGFRVVDCPSLTNQGKNSADIHMVIDALDMLAHHTRYDEFIILSLDADFSPLFHRLRSHDRRVVMLGSGPSSAALRNACDYVIPDDVFISEALLGDDVPSAAPEDSAQDVSHDEIGSPGPQPDGAQSDSTETATGGDEQRAAVRRALAEILAQAHEPVRLAKTAHEITRVLGPGVRDSRWLGAGTFKGLVSQLADDRLSLRIQGAVGFVFDPTRHDIEAAFAASSPSPVSGTEAFAGPWADVASRMVRVLGLPAFQPEQWAAAFIALAADLNEQPFESMARLDATVAEACGLSRARIHFVTTGLALRSYPFTESPGHTPMRLAECFLDNTFRLAENAQLVLDEDELQLLRVWMTSDLQ
jgi:hypothetical protein